MSGSFLRQSTASQSRAIGPFLDSTDFLTPETALTINNTDIKLVVNGGTSANKNSGGGTHRVNGVYSVTFDATDTATVGEFEVSVVVSGALPVFHKFWVLEEAVYDALFAASALGYVANAPVNVAQFGGTNGTFASGRPEVNTTHAAGTAWGSGAITAASIASNAITSAQIAADAIGAAQIAADAIGSSELAATAASEIATAVRTELATELARVDVATSTRMATYTQPTGFLAATFPTAVASTTNITAGTITTVTNLTNAPPDSSGTTTLLSRLSATRAGYLDNLSSGAVATASKLLKYVQLLLRKDAAIATDNSAELTEINADGGSGGGSFANTTDSQEALRDRGDAAWITATGFSTHSASDVWAVGTRVLTAATNISGPIADAVWEEAIADHSGTSGSTAEQLAAAGAAGDPWATAVPGAYSAGQAGYILGTNLNATVSSRLASASYTAPDNAGVASIQAVTDNLPDSGALTSIAQASALATVDTVVDAIKAKTDQLTFTVTGQVDANAESMNGAAILGNGTSGNLWRGE